MHRRAILAAITTAVIGLAGASSASAQTQSGLVNVAVTNNTVQVPIGIAANVCQVSVNVLAQSTSTSAVNCKAVSGATAFEAPSSGGGSANQQGLVNLDVSNNTIQVPVGIAANLCGIAANVLAQNVSTGSASCTALTNATASR